MLRKVKTSPYLTPLSGVPGSPQLTTENNRITLSLVFGVVNFNYSLKVTIQLVEFEFHIRFCHQLPMVNYQTEELNVDTKNCSAN